MSDIVERLRKHALPDPHDEREVLHAPMLKEAANEIDSLRTQLANATRKLEEARKDSRELVEVVKVSREYIKNELSKTSQNMDKVFGNEKLYPQLRERFNKLIGHLNTIDRAIEQSKGGNGE